MYCDGDGPESVVWQITEVRRRITGTKFVVIQGDEEVELLLDERELKNRVESSVLVADR